MLTAIDHLVIATGDPDAGAGLLERELGLRASGGGRHERLGTFNRLVWLGDSYLELVGVFDERLAAESWLGRPVATALRGGGGLATFALASDALAADVAELRGNGSRLADPTPGERLRPDGRTVRWQVSLPPDLGPDRTPFLIEHDASAAEWTPEDRAERAAVGHPTGGAVRLTTLEIATPDPGALGYQYLRDLGLRVRPSLAGGGARDASVGRQTLRLRPARSSRSGSSVDSTGVVVRLRSTGGTHRRADLLGCSWLVDPA